MEPPEPRCRFLELPTELRLQIYSETLLTSSIITISSAKLTGECSDVVHRLWGNDRSPFPGIPLKHEPVIEESYDPSLLSVTSPATIPLTPGLADAPGRDRPRHACPSLLLVNKQIHHELKSHFNLKHARTASLFLSYPSGLHVFRTLAPSLVSQARSVHLAGIYTPTTFSPTHRAYLPPSCSQPNPSLPSTAAYNAKTIPDSPSQLADLIKSLFGPAPRHAIAKLELRIYYPGDDSYSTVWGDDCSPVVVALRNIFTGDIGITVYRGRHGTGVQLGARANRERRRVVSTVWRRLEEGRRGEPRCGSWVVDELWPDWKVVEEGEEVRGEIVATSDVRGEGGEGGGEV